MNNKMENMEAFEFVLDCLSSNNSDNKERIEKYIAHRGRFGKQAASRVYPEVHNIVITDPILRDIWKNLLKTIDEISKK